MGVVCNIRKRRCGRPSKVDESPEIQKIRREIAEEALLEFFKDRNDKIGILKELRNSIFSRRIRSGFAHSENTQ